MSTRSSHTGGLPALTLHSARRESLLDRAHVSLLFLAAPALLASLARSLETGFRPIMLGHLLIYSSLFAAYGLRAQLALQVRARIVSVLVLLAGLGGVFTYGLSGMGVFLIGLATLLASVLVSRKAGFVVLVTGATGLGLIALAVSQGLLTFSLDFNRYVLLPTSWLNAMFGLGILGAVVFALGKMQELMTDTVKALSLKTEALKSANDQLQQEVRARLQAEQSLIQEKETIQTTLRSIGDGVIATDAKGRIDFINPVAESLTGWSLEEARSKPLLEVFALVDGDTGEAVVSPVERCLAENRIVSLSGPTALISRSGRKYQIRDSAAPIRGASGELTGAILVFQDATEEYDHLKEVQHQATHDPLTGLLNRQEFERRLANALDSAREHGSVHSLAYVDLDHFKMVNDTSGHMAGDELLRQVSSLLGSRLRQRDSLARMGGDEFSILLEHCPPDKALEVAQTMLDELKKLEFTWESQTFTLSASIGVVAIEASSISIAQLLRDADVACYAAKNLGRNQVSAFRPMLTVEALEEQEASLLSRLRRAIDSDGFEIYLQPIFPVDESLGHQDVNAERSLPVAHEVLLRFRDGIEVLSADQFLPLAQRHELMPSIDRWVVTKVLATLAGAFVASRVCINLSGESLADSGDFIDFLKAQLDLSGVDPGQLCFELSESAVRAAPEQSHAFIHAAKRVGCEISLDQFGSVFPSAGSLRELPVDYLKIDGAFVEGVQSRSESRDLVREICALGRTLHMETIAGDVENRELAKDLLHLGVDYAQGFGLGRPAPIA